MKKLSFLFLLLAPLSIHAQIAPGNAPLGSVPAAQQRVWDLTIQLNDANLNLSLMKLDWNRTKLVAALAKAQQEGDTDGAQKIQQKIDDLDHQKSLDKQRHDLNAQIIQARIDKDQGKVDSLIFQLKELQ